MMSAGPARPAGRLLSVYLVRTGYKAITLPPLGIYMLQPALSDAGLVAHEQVHWLQYRRLGLVRFYALYLWYLWRYGYERHPMEIEARQISGHR